MYGFTVCSIRIVQFSGFKPNSDWHSNATKFRVGEPFQRTENLPNTERKLKTVIYY